MPLRTTLTPASARRASNSGGYASDVSLAAPGPDRLIAQGRSRDQSKAASCEAAQGPPGRPLFKAGICGLKAVSSSPMRMTLIVRRRSGGFGGGQSRTIF